MEFIIQKDKLQKALGAVEGIISSKNANTILSSILLESIGDSIFLTSSDSDITIKASENAQITKEGSISIPAKKFSSVVKSLAPGDVKISVDSGQNLTLSSDGNRIEFNLLGFEGAKYPMKLQIPELEMNSLDQSLFKRLIQKTFYASAHNDDTRFVFNGLYIESQKDSIKFVATDGKRLAFIQENEISPLSLEEGLIIPSKVISELQKLLGTEGEVFFKPENNQIYFQFDNVALSCRLIQGKFPDYEKVIPSAPSRLAFINKADFYEALKRVSLMASDASHQIKLHFQQNNLSIEAQTPELGSAKENIGIDYDDEEIVVGFNGIFLMDALREMESESIEFKFTDSEMPAIIKPTDIEHYISVIMPLKIT